MRYLLVGLGGFLGANARYILGAWLATRFNTTFPIETLIINITGSFILACFLALATTRFNWPPSYRLLLAVGFVGSYTTFSTFTYESLSLLDQGDLRYFLLNVVGSALLGLFAGYLGLVVGRVL
jgi:CrcB protein